MKKATIDICTPFKKRHRVKGYVEGNLGIHKIPTDGKNYLYTITHITTGYGIVHTIPPFRTLKETKEFCLKLLKKDSWNIADADWGDISRVPKKRLLKLYSIFDEVARELGWRAIDKKVKDSSTPSEDKYKCETCGNNSTRVRYMLKPKGWGIFCLDCQPYDKRIEKI